MRIITPQQVEKAQAAMMPLQVEWIEESPHVPGYPPGRRCRSVGLSYPDPGRRAGKLTGRMVILAHEYIRAGGDPALVLVPLIEVDPEAAFALAMYAIDLEMV